MRCCQERYIHIQTGCGTLRVFRADDSYGVAPLDATHIRHRSDLHNKGEGHTHAVCTHAGAVAILSGTEAECHAWLHSIAAAVERAGVPVALTHPVTYGTGPMEAV